MSPDIFSLRPPRRLETQFYDELFAPIQEFTLTRLQDAIGRREAHLLIQRFRKDIVRYGYVMTEWGPMLLVEPDVLDMRLQPAQRILVDLDMQIVNRLISR